LAQTHNPSAAQIKNIIDHRLQQNANHVAKTTKAMVLFGI